MNSTGKEKGINGERKRRVDAQKERRGRAGEGKEQEK